MGGSEQSRVLPHDGSLHLRTSAAVDDAPAPAATDARAIAVGNEPRVRNNFDGLRLAASLLVAYGHQTVDQTGTMGLRLVMFFSISGFLVSGSWTRDPHAGRFLARRLLRIWPAFATVIVLCAAISWIFPAPDMPEISRLASLFYLTNLWFDGFDWGFFPFAHPMMNPSLWMLPFEIDLYLGFVLIAIFGRSARITVAIALLLLASRAAQTTAPTGGLLECWSPYFGGFFAFGVLLRDVPRLRDRTVTAAFVASGIGALVLGERTGGLLLIIPPAAVWIGRRSWPGLRAAARYGDLSLGIFLWSYPVQQVTRLWLEPATDPLLQLGVVLLQVVPIAWLSYRLIEAPALARKPRRPGGVPGDPATDGRGPPGIGV